MTNEEILSALKGQWGNLLKKGQPLIFHKGQVLVYEGHDPYGVFVIQSGDIQFTKGKSSCPAEHFWHSPKGNVLGVEHFFDGSPFCCTCVATSDCRVVFISKTQLLPFATK
ncbi:MAG: cyclic nucleotide-binding domain-containing protein [Deltaproteobacteria bacterium]|nr:cyclic nucleotide-binding domain-containing protein [Deltaproteobacteria bacterium]